MLDDLAGVGWAALGAAGGELGAGWAGFWAGFLVAGELTGAAAAQVAADGVGNARSAVRIDDAVHLAAGPSSGLIGVLAAALNGALAAERDLGAFAANHAAVEHLIVSSVGLCEIAIPVLGVDVSVTATGEAAADASAARLGFVRITVPGVLQELVVKDVDLVTADHWLRGPWARVAADFGTGDAAVLT